jgi:hypothetical protein
MGVPLKADARRIRQRLAEALSFMIDLQSGKIS